MDPPWKVLTDYDGWFCADLANACTPSTKEAT